MIFGAAILNTRSKTLRSCVKNLLLDPKTLESTLVPPSKVFPVKSPPFFWDTNVTKLATDKLLEWLKIQKDERSTMFPPSRTSVFVPRKESEYSAGSRNLRRSGRLEKNKKKIPKISFASRAGSDQNYKDELIKTLEKKLDHMQKELSKEDKELSKLKRENKRLHNKQKKIQKEKEQLKKKRKEMEKENKSLKCSKKETRKKLQKLKGIICVYMYV